MVTQDVAITRDVVIVGRIGAAYGVRGWVHVSSFTEPPENLLSYSPWLINQGAAEKENRDIILQSLFSRSETGLLKHDTSPKMPTARVADIFKGQKQATG